MNGASGEAKITQFNMPHYSYHRNCHIISWLETEQQIWMDGIPCPSWMCYCKVMSSCSKDNFCVIKEWITYPFSYLYIWSILSRHIYIHFLILFSWNDKDTICFHVKMFLTSNSKFTCRIQIRGNQMKLILTTVLGHYLCSRLVYILCIVYSVRT